TIPTLERSQHTYAVRPCCRFCDVYFFFQEEDGIRDGHVTGVQTCALPISCPRSTATRRSVDISFRPRSTSDRCAGERPASAAISVSVRRAASRRVRRIEPRASRITWAVSL